MKHKWPNTKKEHLWLKERQKENYARCVNNKSENWMLEKLKKTGLKWTRQAIWGFRMFDFWSAKLGIEKRELWWQRRKRLGLKFDSLTFGFKI
jgi:hypothetical protein